ncbi:hypothetical protein MP638_004803 [Amoeboaphelidium occidentale]|nr:hypothetical protein MP638_004803 [Amoeboaphelidium occidentale]
MMIRSDDLVLKVASKEEHRQSIINNYGEWGVPLTLEQYFIREQELQHPDALFAPFVPWIVTDSKGSDILAQCETFENDVCVYMRVNDTNSNNNGHVQMVQGKAYGVASVFVPKQHRGKGYGFTMMKKLHNTLQDAKTESFGSYLYSDIGPKFYERNSWMNYSPYQMVISVDDAEELPFGDATDLAAIKREDLEVLTNTDNITQDRIVKEFLLEQPEGKNAVAVAFKSSAKILNWARVRASVFSRFLCPELEFDKRPYGHVINIGQENQEFMTYFHDFKEKKLYVNKRRVLTSKNALGLLNAAIIEAKSCKLNKVIMFNPCDTLCQAICDLSGNNTLFKSLLFSTKRMKSEDFKNMVDIELMKGVRFQPGDGSIPAMTLFDENIINRCDSSYDPAGVDYHWFDNEKYLWV